MRVLMIDDHEFHVTGDQTEPGPIVVDDQRPIDADACEHCDGLGAIVVGLDEAERPLDESCGWCDGSGLRTGWAGAA